jgi:hypothetical protein
MMNISIFNLKNYQLLPKGTKGRGPKVQGYIHSIGKIRATTIATDLEHLCPEVPYPISSES